MPRVAIEPSKGVARLLRARRVELGLTLRDVEVKSARFGQAIPYATLAKVEQGKVDPGVRRLHLLLRLYDLPTEIVHDLMDLEDLSGQVPRGMSQKQLRQDGVEFWKKGDLQKGFSCLFALKSMQPETETDRLERQKGLLSFAIAAGSHGSFRLARTIIDDLLVEPPAPELVVPVLIQAAVCWHWLGSADAALAFLAQAEARVAPDDHQQSAWIFHERASTLASLGFPGRAQEAIATAIRCYGDAADRYGEQRALGVQIRLHLENGQAEAGLELARRARDRSAELGYQRLAVLRRIDEGRALLKLERHRESVKALQDALAEAISSQDQLALFYSNYYLWKAQREVGSDELGELAYRSARYYVRFVDEASPEVQEIRSHPRGDAHESPS